MPIGSNACAIVSEFCPPRVNNGATERASSSERCRNANTDCTWFADGPSESRPEDSICPSRLAS